MNLRNGLMRAPGYCAALLVAGLFSPARLPADDFFQQPRTTQQPTSQQLPSQQPQLQQPPASQRIAPVEVSREGGAPQQPQLDTFPYQGNPFQGADRSRAATNPDQNRSAYGNTAGPFSPPQDAEYGRESHLLGRDASPTASVGSPLTSPGQRTALKAEASPDALAATAESRPIGSTQKSSEATATSSATDKLSLASPARLFTAVMFVVFLILLTAKFWKKHIPGAAIPIPAESLTVLGERKLNKNHSICLVRLGSRVLVLGASADGLRTLTEITDPVEIDFLSGMARSSQPESVFTSALGSFMTKSGGLGLNARSPATTSRTSTRPTEVPHV